MKLKGKHYAIIFLILFVLGCLVSVVFEELIPYWNSGQKNKFWSTLFGAPIMITAACLITYGGFLIVKEILTNYFNNPTVAANIGILKHGPKHDKSRARNENFKFLWQCVKTGVLYFFLGWAILFLGSLVLNYYKNPF